VTKNKLLSGKTIEQRASWRSKVQQAMMDNDFDSERRTRRDAAKRKTPLTLSAKQAIYKLEIPY
jgi:hypothetical protein